MTVTASPPPLAVGQSSLELDAISGDCFVTSFLAMTQRLIFLSELFSTQHLFAKIIA